MAIAASGQRFPQKSVLSPKRETVLRALGMEKKLGVLRYLIWAVRGSDPEKR
jgi:hypothetical protein